jgi:hypothetical protein
MKAILLGSLLLASLSGCAMSTAGTSPLDRTVSVDSSLSAELPYVEQAAANWENAIPGLRLNVVLQACQGQGDEICMVAQTTGGGGLSSDDLGAEQNHAWGSGIVLFTSALQNLSRGSSSLYAIDVTIVAGHELGHALGCVHIGAGNLMAPILSESLESPTANDVADLWAHIN